MRRMAGILSLACLSSLAMTVFASSASSQTADERAIRAAGEAWQRYVAAQQVDSIADVHTADAVVMFGNSPVLKGSSAIRGAWAEIVKLPNLKMQWTPERIVVASPTLATEYGTYTDSYDTPTGKASDSGSYVTIWQKVNGRWRVALDAPVSSMPAATPECPKSEK